MRVEEIRSFLEPRVHTKYMRHKSPGFADVLSIFADHPTWGTRLDDIYGIWVQRSRLNAALQVKLLTNRRWFVVSWRDCAARVRPRRQGTQTVSEKRLVSAMRRAIRCQTLAWRQQHPETVCALCQTRVGTFHVDHKSPAFSDLKTMFLVHETDAGRADAIPLEFGLHRPTSSAVFNRVDDPFKRRWQSFHRRHATFQLLCLDCNLRKSNR